MATKTTAKTKTKLPNYLRPAREVFKFKRHKKASAALKEALSIISMPGRWVQNELAVEFPLINDFEETFGMSVEKMSAGVMNAVVDDCLDSCKTTSKNAHAFCALGAVQFVDGPVQKSAEGFLREAAKVVTAELEDEALEAIEKICKFENRNWPIFNVNDEHGLDATKQMFRLAIKRAEAAGK